VRQPPPAPPLWDAEVSAIARMIVRCWGAGAPARVLAIAGHHTWRGDMRARIARAVRTVRLLDEAASGEPS
jgi:hypothetical protein